MGIPEQRSACFFESVSEHASAESVEEEVERVVHDHGNLGSDFVEVLLVFVLSRVRARFQRKHVDYGYCHTTHKQGHNAKWQQRISIKSMSFL